MKALVEGMTVLVACWGLMSAAFLVVDLVFEVGFD